MTDTELAAWLQENHEVMEQYEARDVVDALVALLREAEAAMKPSWPLKARLRVVLGEGQ